MSGGDMQLSVAFLLKLTRAKRRLDRREDLQEDVILGPDFRHSKIPHWKILHSMDPRLED